MPNDKQTPEPVVLTVREDAASGNDPKADRGDNFSPTEEKAEVELTAAEIEAVTGKKEPDKEPAKTADGKTAETVTTPDKDGVKQPDKEPARAADGKFIPKARFDEVNNKAKAKVAALENELSQLRARLAPAGDASDVAALTTALDAKTEEYGQLLADGNLADAKAVMSEINKLNRSIVMVETSALTAEHTTESKNVDALGGLVELYKQAYPVFDDAQPETYQQEMVDYVASLQGRFELTGSQPAEALREAVELAVAKFGLDVAPEPQVPGTPAPNKGEARKAGAVDKALTAAKGQPPVLGKGVGEDSDKAGMSKIDINQLDFEQFNRLPAETLKRLRGDFA